MPIRLSRSRQANGDFTELQDRFYNMVPIVFIFGIWTIIAEKYLPTLKVATDGYSSRGIKKVKDISTRNSNGRG